MISCKTPRCLHMDYSIQIIFTHTQLDIASFGPLLTNLLIFDPIRLWTEIGLWMCITLFLMLEKANNVIWNTAMSKCVIVHIKKNKYFQAFITSVTQQISNEVVVVIWSYYWSTFSLIFLHYVRFPEVCTYTWVPGCVGYVVSLCCIYLKTWILIDFLNCAKYKYKTVIKLQH